MSSTKGSKYILQRENVWKSMQFQVLDIIKPLLVLMNMLASESTHPSFHLLESTVRLWAAAHYSLTKNRRVNIMSGVFPQFAALAKDSTKFAPSEIGFLFGPSFMSSLLQSIDNAAKMKLAAKKATSQTTDRRSSQMLASRNQQPLLSAADAPSFSSTKRTSYSSSNKRYDCSDFIQPVSSQMCLTPVEGSSFVGGRIRRFAAAWHTITGVPWVLDTVFRGLWIDFETVPLQFSEPLVGGMTGAMSEICDREVADLLSKGAIVPIPYSSPGFYSRLFAVPKPHTDLFRPIINLKPVNSCIRYEHFKMEGLDSVKHLLREGDWMVRLDLKDAYLTVPISEAHRQFLQFRWQGRAFQFVCMAFGLAPAPRAFTKLLKPVMAFLRARGVRAVIYLDDILFLNQDPEKLRLELRDAVALLESLGFLINWGKSMIEPSRAIQYLGVIICSLRMSFSLPVSDLEPLVYWQNW